MTISLVKLLSSTAQSLLPVQAKNIMQTNWLLWKLCPTGTALSDKIKYHHSFGG